MADAPETVLSLCGRRWQVRAGDERLARALSQRHDLPEPVGRVLAGRGIGLDEAADFLNPTLRGLLPDPSVLKDMDRAAARIAGAVLADEPVAVFADYDVDGATAAAILTRFFRALDRPLRVYVPDRVAEGYGPNAAALLRLKTDGAGLVIAVDCGTTAFAPLQAAAAAGLDVVVLDHHVSEDRLPPAFAVVNPNRLDEAGALRQLAACGVTFLTVVAVNRTLRQAGFYAARPEPDLLSWLDLVALGSICDVVPLVGVNRALVAQGLKVLARRCNTGLVALADQARLSERVDAYHAAFLLGPRVNAGGRIGRADLGARLLATDDPVEAAELAALLDGHNEDRKAIEAAVLRAAIAQVEGAPADPGPVVLAAGEGWHPGVVGIVAGRLKERYNRPACVVALDGGVGKASGRSVPGIDLGAAVIEARRAGLLLSGGGHPMAAGFEVEAGRVAALRDFFDAHVRARVAGPLVPMLELDGVLAVGGATAALAAMLSRLGPFGAGNPEPRFMLRAAQVARAGVVGGNHVSCYLSDGDSGRLRAIAFRALDTPLGRALLTAGGAPLHLAGILRVDRWNGEERAQFHIEDAIPLWPSEPSEPP